MEERDGMLVSKLGTTAVGVRSQKVDLRRDSSAEEEHLAGKDFRM